MQNAISLLTSRLMVPYIQQTAFVYDFSKSFSDKKPGKLQRKAVQTEAMTSEAFFLFHYCLRDCISHLQSQ